jgi:hypothetical protein
MMRNGRLAVPKALMRLTHVFAFGCLLMLAASVTGFAQDPASGPASFAQKISSLERTWTEGGNPEYFDKAGNVANELIALEGDHAAEAAQLLDVLLRKSVDPLKVESVDLSAKANAARAILRAQGQPTSGVRQTEVKALARFLGSVRGELIPNFVPKAVTFNVRPPVEGAGPRVAGMDPNAIADPVAREKYKTALLENRRNSVQNSRQIVLRDLQADFSQPIVERMQRFANTDEVALSLVQEWVRTAHLTDIERAVVFSSPAQK